MTGKPVFFYTKGTSYLFNFVDVGFDVSNSGVIHFGEWQSSLKKNNAKIQKNAAVAGLDGRTVSWTGDPASDPFTALMNPEIWNSIQVAYPAAVLGMGASIDSGVSRVIAAINNLPTGTPFALGGYSQGAAVMSTVLNEIMSGSLTSRAPDFLGGTMFGNPRRKVDWRGPVGGTWSGIIDSPGSTTGGHGSFPTTGNYARLTYCPDTWVEFTHPTDIFSSIGDNTNGLNWTEANKMFLQLSKSQYAGKLISSVIIPFLQDRGYAENVANDIGDAIVSICAIGGYMNDFTDAFGEPFSIGGGGHTTYPAEPPYGDPDNGLTGFQIALKYLDSLADEYVRSPSVLPPTSAGWANKLYPPATQWYDTPSAAAIAVDFDYGGERWAGDGYPIRFSSPTAVLGVSPTDKTYLSRTLTGANMRVASAPSGSPLTVEVQHWDGFTWITVGTLTIASGSVTEASISFSQSQDIGDMLRINCTSVGSSTAATGVVVDVLAV